MAHLRPSPGDDPGLPRPLPPGFRSRSAASGSPNLPGSTIPPVLPPRLGTVAHPPVSGPQRPPVHPPAKPASPAASRRPKLLAPDELDRFSDLLLFARTTVDGFFAGKHRSPYPGASAEFRDFRNYVPGDPIDRIDWRAYGRSRRLFIRRYEDETDMVAYLLVDTSASMRYAGPGRPAKHLVAARLAAALAYLMLHQGDKAALGLYADGLKQFLPPGGTRRHLHEVVRALEDVQPNLTTGGAAALRQCAAFLRKRGRLIVLSDFLEPAGPLLDALSQFLHRGFNILLLQVLDPDEIDLPEQAVARFVDLETGEEVEVDAAELRQAYRRRVEDSLRQLAREAEARRIEHQLVRTSAPYTTALEAYLGFRGARR